MTAGAATIPLSRDGLARRRARVGVLVAVWLGALSLAAASAPPLSVAAEGAYRELLQTEEGGRLVRLWQDMLDHSSNLIYSPSMFHALADDLERADADLVHLSERRILDQQSSECLRNLFHLRYSYIRDWHYTKRSTVRLSGEAATRKTALWVVELQLAVLRRPPACEAEEELGQAAVRNIGYQLTFVHHLDKFEAESDRRRMALRDKADAGEDVDLEAFEREYLARRSLLLEAYRQRRLPRARSVDELLPYVVALTRAKSSPQGTARESRRAGSL